MSNAFLGSFIAIAAVAVGTLDYTMQSRRLDLGFGQLGPGAYINTFSTRYSDMKADQAAAAETAELRRSALRTLLPEAPAGWTMREWNEADRAQLFRDNSLPTESQHPDPEFAAAENAILQDPTIKALSAASEQQRLAAEKAEIRFYQRGDSLIALRLDFTKAGGGGGGLGAGMTERALSIVTANMTSMSSSKGFQMIAGVPYSRNGRMYLPASPGNAGGEDLEVMLFQGQMGGEVTISVNARATDADVADLLAQIDYDRLNKLLSTPMEGVGSAAVALSASESTELAEKAVDAQTAAVIARGRAAEEELRNIGRMLADDPATGAAPADAAAAAGTGGGGLLGMFMQRASDVGADAAKAEEPAAPAAGTLASFGTPAPVAAPAPTPEPAPAAVAEQAAVAPPAPAAPAAEVRIRRPGDLGGENCQMTATGKRCSLLGD
jgi:hypothetical protein